MFMTAIMAPAGPDPASLWKWFLERKARFGVGMFFASKLVVSDLREP